MTHPHWTLRRPGPHDAHALAAVHNRCWRETYGKLLPVDSQDADASALERRQNLWAGLVQGDRASQRLMLAETGSGIIGFALAIQAVPENTVRSTQLRMRYVLRRFHGSGAGQALLDAVVGSEPCQLWVARENRRAQAFYRRNGFVPDGAEKQEDRADGLWVMRWVR